MPAAHQVTVPPELGGGGYPQPTPELGDDMLDNERFHWHVAAALNPHISIERRQVHATLAAAFATRTGAHR